VKLIANVKPGSRRESVELQPDGTYTVRVNAPPIEGRANERTAELLADFLNMPKSKLTLISGAKSRRKVFEVK